jgi:hypothetical protein
MYKEKNMKIDYAELYPPKSLDQIDEMVAKMDREQVRQAAIREQKLTTNKLAIADGMSYHIGNRLMEVSFVNFSAYITGRYNKDVRIPVQVICWKSANVTTAVLTTFPFIPITSLKALPGHVFTGQSLQHEGDKHDNVVAMHYALQRALKADGSSNDHFKRMLYNQCKIMLEVLREDLAEK